MEQPNADNSSRPVDHVATTQALALRERFDNCDFRLPEEYAGFFQALAARAADGLNPSSEQQWKRDGGSNRLLDETQRSIEGRRSWLCKALSILKAIATKENIDPAPLYWFERYVHGETERNIDKARSASDAIQSLQLLATGKDEFIRVSPATDSGQADTKADKEKKSEKSLAPNDVNDMARYIREQRKQIAAGKRPKATKKALIEELHPDATTCKRMQKELQPSRYGWLLDI